MKTGETEPSNFLHKEVDDTTPHAVIDKIEGGVQEFRVCCAASRVSGKAQS
jgi:hypothetical protein